VTLSFLLFGHTKFAPDWCFGLAKQCFRRSNVSSLDDIANTVSQSSVVNVPQLVGSLDGTIYVPTYDWSTFIEDKMVKSALKGIHNCNTFVLQPLTLVQSLLKHPVMAVRGKLCC